MEHSTIIKITSIVNRSYTTKLIDELFKNGIECVFIEAGRINMLEERKKMLSIGNKKTLINDPSDIISFFINTKFEKNVLDMIDQVLDLKTPGKGSVFTSDANIIKSFSPIFYNNNSIFIQDTPFTAYSELAGISCIVQRGSGDQISQLVLDSGISVPVTTYGIGTGVRDKLGLLRITIPAEKEVITLVMSKYDVESVMELMIAVGKLSQPGKGFIYDFPVRSGFVNTKISRGAGGQVASFEQIISAIDSLKGGMEWRRSKVDIAKSAKLQYIEKIIELDLICNEGFGFELMKVAMSNGASGATISTIKFNGRGDEASKLLPSHEICRMIVSPKSVETISSALEIEGAFNDQIQGLLYTNQVEKAFTYLGKS